MIPIAFNLKFKFTIIQGIRDTDENKVQNFNSYYFNQMK